MTRGSRPRRQSPAPRLRRGKRWMMPSTLWARPRRPPATQSATLPVRPLTPSATRPAPSARRSKTSPTASSPFLPLPFRPMSRVRLEETKDWQLADRSHDVRGRELRDSVGRALGTIKTMIVDTDARRVESVVLEDGNEYPVRDLQIMEQAVYFIPTAVDPSVPAAATEAAYTTLPASEAPEALVTEPLVSEAAESELETSEETGSFATAEPGASAPEAPAAPRFTWQPAAP